MTAERTLPCPFCAGSARFLSDTAMSYTVRCDDCGAQLGSCDIPSYTSDRNWLGKMKAEMINLWNTRTPAEPEKDEK